MERGYLTPEQQQQFMAQLAQQEQQGASQDAQQGGGPDESALTPEEQQQAMEEGAQMAAADAQAGDASQAEPQTDAGNGEQQEANPEQDTLSQLGFSSLEELANAYRDTLRSTSELKEMLTQLTALQQATDNAESLEDDPDAAIKRVIRTELKPMYEKARNDARNRLVQEKWKASSSRMTDLAEQMGDIKAYFDQHPELALSEDGLDRAYDAVRSAKYRSEADMMADPEFLKRAAANDKIREAVIEAYLQGLARNGDAAPQSITDGGNTPLTGRKTVSGMDQARSKLAAMLGMK